MTIFDYLVWTGAAVTLIGLGLLIWCILRVMRARRSVENDEQMREVLQKIVPVNLGALLLSALGLMCVVIGLFLG